jgi:hypothetical protein
MLASMGLQAFFPQLLTAEQYRFMEYTGATISGVGLVHKSTKKVEKEQVIDKIILKLKKKK